MTEAEKKVVEILTQHEVSPDAWGAPIFAVDRAMGWSTAHTREFVVGLIQRDLIKLAPIVREGPIYDPKARWDKGSAYPVSPEDAAS
jgi:hypothetical protein